MDLEVVPSVQSTITLYCDNSRAIANSKEPRSHKRGKHIERKYLLIQEIVGSKPDCIKNNLADPFTKYLTQKIFDQHVEGMGVRCIATWLGV